MLCCLFVDVNPAVGVANARFADEGWGAHWGSYVEKIVGDGGFSAAVWTKSLEDRFFTLWANFREVAEEVDLISNVSVDIV